MQVGGAFLVSTHPVTTVSSLPCFKCESEEGFSVFTHHSTTHPPSLASNASQRGCFQSSSTTAPPTPPPSLQMRVLLKPLVSFVMNATTPDTFVKTVDNTSIAFATISNPITLLITAPIIKMALSTKDLQTTNPMETMMAFMEMVNSSTKVDKLVFRLLNRR